MQKRLLKLCSWILTLALLINMLPMSIFAEAIQETAATEADPEVQSTEPAELSEAYIVDEITEKRTAYSKEFLLSSGVHMAAVYPQAVHYETANGWEEIDNTLITHADGSLSNTAGVWDVRFPGQLTKDQSITIEKDGYTLSFFMAGELTAQPVIEAPLIPGIPAVEGLTPAAQTELSQLPEDAVAEITVDGTAQSFGVAQMQQAAAQVQPIQRDTQAQYAQTVPEKNHSRLLYADIYQSTDVVYDLESGKVKESVILESYRSSLRGYRYSLDVGEMIPVLEADGSVTFYDKTRQSVVMVMPAPYLVDNAGVYNGDIQVQFTGSGSRHTLFYILPTEWLAAEDRAWPVVLDPIINADLNVNNIQDRTVTENKSYSRTWGMNSCGYDTDTGAQRVYLKYVDLPVLTSADVILEASVHMYKPAVSGTVTTVEARKVQAQWDIDTITWANQPALGGLIKDYAVVDEVGWYGWTVTDIVRDWYANSNTGMVFKASSSIENGSTRNFKQFLSSDYGIDISRPQLFIYFRNNNGLESYWDYTTASAGRAGTGSVNNYTGNLTWVRSDIGFDGNRMPVSISHVYNLNDVSDPDPSGKNNNANDTAGNFLGLGVGWRTNFHQELFLWRIGGTGQDYYIWEDADGTDHYFYATDTNTYEDEDGLEMTLTDNGTGNTKYALTDKQGNTSYFDSGCRLYKQENNQATKSSITVTYCSDAPGADNYYWISTVTDGIGRTYTFNYTNSLLSSIVCTGTDGVEIGRVSYAHDSSKHLTQVTDMDGKVCSYTYDSQGHLLTATDIDGYQLRYTYYPANEAWQPWRIKTVAEYAGDTAGGTLTFTYAHNQTRITDYNGNVQTLQFNDYGNLTAIQDDEGHAQYAQFATNRHTDSGKGNQLTNSSKLQNTVANLMWDSSFEAANPWTARAATTMTRSTEAAYLGGYGLKMVTGAANGGMWSPSFTLDPGQTVTFSAYVKSDAQFQLMLQRKPASGPYVNYESAFEDTDGQWVRRQLSYTNDTGSSLTMWAFLVSGEAGTFYMDCVQVELAASASRYNLVDNGDFTHSGSPAYQWTGSAMGSADQRITDSRTAAPNLSSNLFRIIGNPMAAKELSQTLPYGGEEGDCYVFSGWAWADSAVPNGDMTDRITAGKNNVDPTQSNCAFDITVKLQYSDGESETAAAKFNPGSNTWQYTANAIVAKKAYTSITVTVRYHYNANTVWFDGIGLFKEEFGTSYTYDEDGNVISVTDLQKQTTTYEYDENNNVTAILQDNKAKLTYDYDSYHNVTQATSEEGLTYTFVYDQWGNNTSVSIVGEDGEEINSIAHYSTDGNRLLDVWDPLNRVTYYGYNEQTNRLDWVRYPEDTEATRTEYDYDEQSGKLLSVAAAVAPQSVMSVDYSYENDYLEAIETPTTTYEFRYDDWGLRETVKIGDVPLATYVYHQEVLDGGADDRKNDLDALVYGNDDRVDYEYDDKGRLIKETYEDNATVSYTYDNSGNLATRTDSATGRTTRYYYDLTDRMVKYEDKGENYYYSIGYSYDKLNNLTQLVENVNGEVHTTSYTYDDDNRLTSFTTGNITKEYAYDAYGRVYEQLTKNENSITVVCGEYSYQALRAGEYTSAQVSGYRVYSNSYSSDLTYEYDRNGNITRIAKVNNGVETVIAEYNYDTANQLLSEVLPAQRKTVWTYDNAGNIQTRTEYTWENDSWVAEQVVSYGYYDTSWGDLLTKYNGKDFYYDEIGNLTDDSTWVYTWQHGRQLASMVNADASVTWNYSYDADGLRTKRIRTTNNITTTWEYIYNGGQLVQMTKGGDTLYFTYDATGTPMTITHNDTIYYYATNLLGDVIAILNGNGIVEAEYAYDAWGNPMGTLPTTGIGALNPLRYRGYVYDTETSLYYLQSRYYNPETGRFINGDVFYATGQCFVGNNMFAYCLNNPACRVEIQGYISVEAAKQLVQENADSIIAAGEEFGVDPVTIAGCIYAEQVLNVNWIDTLTDFSLSFLDTSIGIGQVKVSTARMLHKVGLIENKPMRFRFSVGIPRFDMLSYALLDNATNIRYVAAYLKGWQDIWYPKLDISNRPEILGTLYNLGENANRPNRNPKANDFGEFVKENYEMLKELLGL